MDLKNKLIAKYWWARHRIKDYVWNSRGMIVPSATSIGGFIWLIIDPSPEPVVVLLTALLATIIWRRENSAAWYTNAQGNIFKVHFRCDTDGETKRIEIAKDFITGFELVFKYKIEPEAGDSPMAITLDMAFSDEQEFIKIARDYGYVTRAWKNGVQIYQGGC